MARGAEVLLSGGRVGREEPAVSVRVRSDEHCATRGLGCALALVRCGELVPHAPWMGSKPSTAGRSSLNDDTRSRCVRSGSLLVPHSVQLLTPHAVRVLLAEAVRLRERCLVCAAAC